MSSAELPRKRIKVEDEEQLPNVNTAWLNFSGQFLTGEDKHIILSLKGNG